jgi:hypothetical protein
MAVDSAAEVRASEAEARAWEAEAMAMEAAGWEPAAEARALAAAD